MKPSSVTLEQMLDARERRAMIQQDLLTQADSSGCLVCLTLNIAGEYKRTPMTKLLFDKGLSIMESLCFDVAARRVLDEATGSEAFWLLQEDATQVKTLLEKAEDAFPAARLFDFDVLRKDGVKLSRGESRRCLVCGGPVAVCARNRAHGLDAVKAATNSLLRGFCADTLAKTAKKALLDELYTTPKPGLVDRMSNGAHKDMDIPLFEKSADSLVSYFHDAVLLGMDGCGMQALRPRGAAAERAMFEATGGVNTHKGIIYSMGLLLAGMGRVLTDGPAPDTDTAYTCIPYAAALAKEDAAQQLARSQAAPATNGGRVLAAYGAKGATGEAMTGFPHAVSCAAKLRYYRDLEEETAAALAFCDSMAALEDTNLLHRGGADGLAFAQMEASRIRALPAAEQIRALAALDAEMIRRNLSPGGNADMLALAFLLEAWRGLSDSLFTQGDAQ